MPKSTHIERVALCGHTYIGYAFTKAPARYCSICMQRAKHRIRVENAAKRRMVRERPEARDSFNIARSARLAIYDRDEWTCQLCLDPVDRDTEYPDPWSPSLDHIICQSWTDEPDHSPANLRLAHLWCNVMRGNESRWKAEDFAPPRTQQS